MKLADDETKVAEYYFKALNDVSNMSILTNRRLIVIYGNAEESFPISKITAVRLLFHRSKTMIIIGIIIALIGIALIKGSPVVGILGLAIGGAMAYFGIKGKTYLLIQQMAGDKEYVVRGKDQKLIEFIDAVNSKLS
jgi:hypothetical protein